MAQKVTSIITGTMAQIIDAIVDEGFCRANAENAGGKFVSLDVSGNTADNFTVTTRGMVPSTMLPDLAKKFLGADVPLEYTQRWKAPSSDGSRSAEVIITVKNGLLSVIGTQTFAPASSDPCVVDTVFTGGAKSNIPLIGGKVAAKLEPKFARAIEMQSKAITDWIAHRLGPH